MWPFLLVKWAPEVHQLRIGPRQFSIHLIILILLHKKNKNKNTKNTNYEYSSISRWIGGELLDLDWRGSMLSDPRSAKNIRRVRFGEANRRKPRKHENLTLMCAAACSSMLELRGPTWSKSGYKKRLTWMFMFHALFRGRISFTCS